MQQLLFKEHKIQSKTLSFKSSCSLSIGSWAQEVPSRCRLSARSTLSGSSSGPTCSTDEHSESKIPRALHGSAINAATQQTLLSADLQSPGLQPNRWAGPSPPKNSSSSAVFCCFLSCRKLHTPHFQRGTAGKSRKRELAEPDCR